MKLHGIKIIRLEGVDVEIEDAEFEVSVENDSVWVQKDVGGSAQVNITKGLLIDACEREDLETLAQWCSEIIEEEYEQEE